METNELKQAVKNLNVYLEECHSDTDTITITRPVIKAIKENYEELIQFRHGKWHIPSDNPYDESGMPTEEGWYRIITADGEESTDYYFNKPTLIGNGVVYWKNTKQIIRAWAKIYGKETTMSNTMNFPKTAEEFINSYKFNDKYETYTNGAELIPVFRVKQMIEHYFAADVAPERRGEWLLFDSGAYGLLNIYKCSVCGEARATYTDTKKYNYCPNCGARMDGKSNG